MNISKTSGWSVALAVLVVVCSAVGLMFCSDHWMVAMTALIVAAGAIGFVIYSRRATLAWALLIVFAGAIGFKIYSDSARDTAEDKRINAILQELQLLREQRDNLNRARDATQECFSRQRKFQERAEKGEVPQEVILKTIDKEEKELAKALAQIEKSDARLEELEELASGRLTADDLKLFIKQLEEDRISLEGWRWLANDLLKFWKKSSPQ